MDTQAKTVVATCCKNCVFANSDSCQLKKIDKLVEHGGIFVHKEDKDKKWVEIEGRICRFYRNKEWKDKHENEDLATLARKEATLSFGLLIYINDDVIENAPDLLHWTMISINDLILKPKEMIFAVRSEKLNLMQSIKFVNKNVKTEIPFRVEVITELVGKNRTYNICIPKFNSQYIGFINAGYMLPPTFILKLDKFINDECGRVIMIQSQNVDGDGLIIQKNAAKLFKSGEDSYPIEKDIEEVCKEQRCEHLIKTVDEYSQWI